MPRTPEATPAGGLDTAADDTGEDDTGDEDTGTDGSSEVAGLDVAGFGGGRLNACGLLTPPGTALDPGALGD